MPTADVDWYFGIGGKDKLGDEVSDMQWYRCFYYIPVENSVRSLKTTPWPAVLYQASIATYTNVRVYTDLVHGL